MYVIEDSLLLKGLQRLMISQATSGQGATVLAKGETHFYKGTYKLTSSQSSIHSLRGPTLASLVKNDEAAPNSSEAFTTTPSAPRDRLATIPSSDGAQASLREF